MRVRFLDGTVRMFELLREADLRGADLISAYLPSPRVVLSARWGRLSSQLTADLMVYDASSHPDPQAFERWAEGGACPYNGVKVRRAANFYERRELWGTGKPSSPYDLMARVLEEHITWKRG